MPIRKFVTHSFKVQELAAREGWLPGARYTNLRDVKKFDRLGFLDIDWKDYRYNQHLKAAQDTRPVVTVARDIVDVDDLHQIIDEAYELDRYCDHVIVVPKDVRMAEGLEERIPNDFFFGFSVPTKYGGTDIPTKEFKRDVHLLGGRPDVQRRLGEVLSVVSLDCNRFTIDAAYGDFFDGDRFRPHPKGGYERCLSDSIRNINLLWKQYRSTDDRGDSDQNAVPR